MSKAYKIVLVSAGQPATNPRLVKEADALVDAGYQVLVIYAYWGAWGDEFTKQMLAQKKWRAICVGGHPVEASLIYFYSRIKFKIARLLFSKFNTFNTAAIARSTPFLIAEAKKHKADLYIGHTLGALPAVVKAAKRYDAKCGFDAEDFHRQEVTDDKASASYLIAKATEDKYLPEVNYLSASSPEIANAYQQLYPRKDVSVILNVFNNSPLQPVSASNSRIKLFWFSQTVGFNRGLEDVAKALKLLPAENFELHLLGDISETDKLTFTHELFQGVNVIFHNPMPPDEIVKFASQFEIGLATEQKTPLNRDICLTNKLFEYLNAGLAVIASNTTAQRSLLTKFPDSGKICDCSNTTELVKTLNSFYEDRNMLAQMKQAAFNASKETLNWQQERVKFLNQVQLMLNTN